ncbi:hypothetical protein GUITHDRAFT_104331 [Guillardia theta CCMP2712]|uniref:Uncharacterized protein n=1 Tax=Guillardia theta (strain CCMP2712) TaxID=905079 RepID=L1JNS9_GUITC|nr:hypothetical protein GUITHDRAFT_104331 [Guillardia theta CCMP2712]EKX49934.1 hypothetical protein GUITHDRAFT_104331 [Guillardia theta CCMP2712]|eukprot:XP_005836914.1 hypothetical protein GUITHDRAFT_104331 [Guillardia theta CCMP2712]
MQRNSASFKIKCTKQVGRKNLKIESERVSFRGAQDQDKKPYKYVVGMYDPEKDRLVIVDPGDDMAKVIALKKRVKGLKDNTIAVDFSKEQARDALVDGFGSKRVKAVHRKRKGQETEREEQDALDSVEKELRVKKEETDAAKKLAGLEVDADKANGPNELAPPCNLAAETVSDVYKRKDLLDGEEWESIVPGQFFAIAQDPESAKQLPAFIRRHINLADSYPDKKDKKRVAKLLSYVSFLVFFHNLPNRFRKSPEVLKKELGIPLALGVHFLKLFAESVGNSYTKPQTQRDRLLLHLAVACLLVTEFEMDFDDLAADLKLHPDKLSAYFREVGAKIKKGAKRGKNDPEESLKVFNYHASLTLPLVFPKRSRGPKG